MMLTQYGLPFMDLCVVDLLCHEYYNSDSVWHHLLCSKQRLLARFNFMVLSISVTFVTEGPSPLSLISAHSSKGLGEGKSQVLSLGDFKG